MEIFWSMTFFFRNFRLCMFLFVGNSLCKTQGLGGRNHLIDFFPWLCLHHFFSRRFCCAGLFGHCITSPPIKQQWSVCWVLNFPSVAHNCRIQRILKKMKLIVSSHRYLRRKCWRPIRGLDQGPLSRKYPSCEELSK